MSSINSHHVIVMSSYVTGSIYAGPPTNFMVTQAGINKLRVSWTPSHISPSRGYLITTGDTRPTDFNAGIRIVTETSSRDVDQQPGTVTYWLVALYMTEIVVGPVSGTVRGEEMSYMYNQ